LVTHHSSSTLYESRAGRSESASTTLDVLELGVQLAILHNGRGVGGSGLPLGRSARGGLLHHLVDLLEGEALGLRDEEVGVDEGASAQASPYEEDAGLEVALVGADHVRGDDGDDTRRDVSVCAQIVASG
jgi:hypothetical protein